MKSLDDLAYEFAIWKEESHELSIKIIETLPKLALPSTEVGIGIAGMALALRALLGGLQEPQRSLIRATVIQLITRGYDDGDEAPPERMKQ
jgi:hypothetical protein